jgi:hypothetical protein
MIPEPENCEECGKAKDTGTWLSWVSVVKKWICNHCLTLKF